MPQSLVNQIFKNTIALMIGRFLVLIFSMIGSIMLVRYLGRGEFGKYSVIYAFLSFFTIFTTMGFEQIIVRILITTKMKDTDEIIGKVTGATFGFCIIAVTITLLVSYFAQHSNEIRFYIMIASIEMLFTPLFVVGYVYQARMEQWIIAILLAVQQFLYTLFIFILIYIHAELINFILFKIVSVFITGVLSRIIGSGHIRYRIILTPDWTREILVKSWPLVVIAFSISIYTRIDQVLIHRFLGEKSVGDYAAAVKVSELFTVVSSTFLAVVYPVFSKFFNESQEYYFKSIQLSFKYLFVFIIPACFIVFLFSDTIISILFTHTFIHSSGVLRIYIWSEIAVFFGGIVMQVLISCDLQRYQLCSTIFGAVINIVLNIILIPTYGIYGSAWATLISYSLSNIFVFLLFKKTKVYALMGIKKLVRISLPVIILFLLYSYKLTSELYVVIFFVLGFPSWLFFSKEITSEDLIIIKKSIFGKSGRFNV